MDEIKIKASKENDEWLCQIASVISYIFDQDTYEFDIETIELFKPSLPLTLSIDEIMFNPKTKMDHILSDLKDAIYSDNTSFGHTYNLLEISRIMSDPLSKIYIIFIEPIVEFLLRPLVCISFMREHTSTLFALLQIAKLPGGIKIIDKFNGHLIIKSFKKILQKAEIIGTFDVLAEYRHHNAKYVHNYEYVTLFKEMFNEYADPSDLLDRVDIDYGENIENIYLKMYPMKLSNEILKLHAKFIASKFS
jgi:hypothetical protein